MSEMKWHHYKSVDVLEKQTVDPTLGLSESVVAERMDKWGKNELPEAKSDSAIVKFFKHFHDVLIYVLLAAAVITILLGHYMDTAVIMAVVIINATIGYFQENKAEKALEGIRDMLSVKATVLRSGNKMNIDAAEMVPGDIAVLRTGDKVPADIRLLEAVNLQVEESSLTGESLAVEKQTTELAENTVLGDRTNMAFAGTAVVAGTGHGVVVVVKPLFFRH